MPFIIGRTDLNLFYVRDEDNNEGWTVRKDEASHLDALDAETTLAELNTHASIVGVEILGVRNTVEPSCRN
jgi:hypothetical protein